jgi:hypothetical protein
MSQKHKKMCVKKKGFCNDVQKKLVISSEVKCPYTLAVKLNVPTHLLK